MATLVLHHARSFFSAFRLPWLTRPTSAPSYLASHAPFSLALPMLQPLLDLLPPIVLAVPKSKVSHSRKSMRSANKGLKDKQNIVNCPACGEAKLAHRTCKTCYDIIVAKFRQQSKQPSSARDSLSERAATRASS